MSDANPKEPLVAILLTMLLPGLGHVYAGNPRRGLLLFGLLGVVVPIIVLSYVLHPATKLSFGLSVAVSILWLGAALYVPVDGFRSARGWNVRHGLQRKASLWKTSLLVVGIPVALALNPITRVGQFISLRMIRAFQVEQHSMEPTLVRGDRVLVDLTIYRRAAPQRGDLVILRYPRDLQRHYLKRILGLPGETVEAKAGRLLINGRPLQAPGRWGALPCYSGGMHDAPVVSVPPEHYFVLGDNCNNSEDSRAFGAIPRENLVGKVYKIYRSSGRGQSSKL